MITRFDAIKLHQTLVKFNEARIESRDFALTLERISPDGNVCASTIVYQGDNYLPESVRRATLTSLPNWPQFFPTFLRVDEQLYQVSLHYTGIFLSRNDFHDLLCHFEETAQKWKSLLDDKDREDLVWISRNSK